MKVLVKKHLANGLTLCRMLCGVLLLCFPVFSPLFCGAYLLGGVTDMLDGTVARKMGTASDAGARLDTVADSVFATAALLKILPALTLPRWLWLWIIGIGCIKLVNVLSGFVCRKRFVTEHTLLNKVTGLLLFCLPLTLPFVKLNVSATVVCLIATVAAVQEGHYIRTGREVQ